MYKKFWSGWFKHADFMILDIIAAELSYFLACKVRLGDYYINIVLYRRIALILLIAELFISVFTSTYRDVLKRNPVKELGSVISHVVKVWIIVMLLVFLFKTNDGFLFSRLVFIFSAVFHIGFSYGMRLFWKRIIKKRLKNKENVALLVIADKDKASDLVNSIRKHNLYGFNIVGVVIWDENMEGQVLPNSQDVQIVASRDTVIDYMCHNWVDEIYLGMDNCEVDKQFIHNCLSMGFAVHRPIETEAHEAHSAIQEIAGVSVITSAIRIVKPGQFLFKRLFDILGGLLGSFFTLLLCLFLAPMIKIKSPGPIFFKQKRVGKNGREFYMYKFRSMYIDAEERKAQLMAQNENEDDFMFKMENDPRIVPGIGNFIRKYSLDEFPQFFNVLKGDMSLVGTRPPTVEEYNKYLPNHNIRLSVRPGITGLWQISGRNDINNFEDVVKLDEQYINDWSFGFDVKIVLKTIGVIFKGTGK